MYQILTPYAWISTLFLCVYSLMHSKYKRNIMRLPPGPWILPVVGNALQIPSQHPEYAYVSWARTYGDLMYTEVFGHRSVIINSQSIARDLLERRGAKYSSRPRMPLLVELIGWNPMLPLLPYGTESYRKQRKWVQSAFGEKKSVQMHERLKERETYILILGLMETPDDYALHIKRYVAAMILESVYGHRITSLEDKYVTLMDRAMETSTSTGTLGATLVDIFPFRAAFKRFALRAQQLVRDGHEIPYRMAKQASGCAPPSFVSALIEEAEKAGRIDEDENDVRWSPGSVYAAGTDTTKTILLTFLLATVLHPEAFRKAQEEMDRVIGKDRLPRLEDKHDLPYLECVLKETYRWHPPLPLGLPHYTTEDDEYNGYYIPKGTIVMANMWGICRDERIWNDPAVFRPERFFELTPSDAEQADPRNIVFGYGRRLCPGRLFAESTLFLTIATMVATLDISKARDANGEEIPPEASFRPGFFSYPDHFVCAISPRSSATRSLVAQTLANVST